MIIHKKEISNTITIENNQKRSQRSQAQQQWQPGMLFRLLLSWMQLGGVQTSYHVQLLPPRNDAEPMQRQNLLQDM